MAGCPVPQARRLLGELARACLITEHAPGRYAFHDLLLAYAAGQARDIDTGPELDAARGRLLDHYLHTAAAAAAALDVACEKVVLGAPGPDVTLEQVTSNRQARAWLEAEHHALIAAVTLAADSGFDRHAWQLPWTMASYLALWGHFREWAAIETAALAAATRLGDLAGQAASGRHLARAHLELGASDRAAAHYADALAAYRQLGDRLGEARVQQGLAVMAGRQGRHGDGFAHCEQALRLYRAVGHQPGEASMLNNTAWCLVQIGDYQQGRAFCERALALSAEIGEREIQAVTWDTLGYLEHLLGNFSAAVACYRRALDFCRELGTACYEADFADRLGDAHHAAGELPEAAAAWRQALRIFDSLSHPGAGKVRAKLAGTGR
jgi:tetratricopeptide (TPR) repeat protein